MEIREPHSIGRLFLESFSVANRAFGRLLAFIVIAMAGTVFLELLLLIGIPFILIQLLNVVFSAFLCVLLIKIFATQIDGDLATLADLMSSSVLSAVYTLILGLICGLATMIVGFVLVLLSKVLSPRVVLLIVPIYLFFMVRLMFAPISIALREQGPIHAIMYSWELTRGHFFRSLLVFATTILLPQAFFYGVGYGLYVAIPLYFADSFDLAHLSATWWIVLALLVVAMIFITISMMAFWVLAFLNLDYTEGEAADSQVLPTPQLHDNGTSLSTGAVNASKTAHAPNVQVLHASVKTHSSDDSLDKHLNEVFQPLPQGEGTVDAEEDRMPTIVFDDEMAAKLQKEREEWEQAQKNKKNSNDNGEDSVKMSK